MITLTAPQQALIQVPEGYSGWLSLAVAAAGRAVEAHCGRIFEAATRTETYDGTGSNSLPLRVWPITSIVSVTISDVAQTVADFYIDGRVMRWRKGLFPYADGNVVVTYVAGSLPDDVVLATIMTAQAMINAAAVDPNTLGESMAGYSASFAPEGAGSVPRGAQSLLTPHRSRFAV